MKHEYTLATLLLLILFSFFFMLGMGVNERMRWPRCGSGEAVFPVPYEKP